MLYTPPDESLRLWDTWILQDDDTYHLFHLQRHKHEFGCSSIGHALTHDWQHWETLPAALEQGKGTAWDAGPLMTGMTLKHDGRYYMFYGAMTDQIQRIGLATSADLIHWEKMGDSPILEPGGEWYETDPTQAINYETAWRDPYVVYHAPENCFYMFICARASYVNSDLGGGCIAVASSDNLLDWTLLPPAYVSDVWTCLEVPEYFWLDGQHYISFTTSYHFGTPYPTHDPYQVTGTFYLVSDDMLAGYSEPEFQNALNAGMPNHAPNYVGRSVPADDDSSRRIFYYHHVFPRQVGEPAHGSLSAPKYLQANTDGQLELLYAADLIESCTKIIAQADAPLNFNKPYTLLHDAAPNGIYEARIKTLYAGICFHMSDSPGTPRAGLAVWLAPSGVEDETSHVLLGSVFFVGGSSGMRSAFGAPAALRKLGSRHSQEEYHVRVVCKSCFVDVYVDDVLYLSHTYDPIVMPSAGGVGVFYAGKPKDISVSDIVIRCFIE